MRKALTVTLLCLPVMWGAVVANAAQPVYAYVIAGGVEIQGESDVMSLARENMIVCVSFQCVLPTSAIWAPWTGADPMPLNTPRIVITKRIDRATPLLWKALAEQEEINAGFRFYRPDPAGTGQEEFYYEITIEGGRIAAINTRLPDTLSPETAILPAVEEITFTYPKISCDYTPTQGVYTIPASAGTGDVGPAFEAGKDDTGQTPPAGGQLQIKPRVRRVKPQ